MDTQVLDPFSMKNMEKFEHKAPLLSERIEVGSFTLSGPHHGTRRLYHDDRSGLQELHRRGPAGKAVRGLRMDLDKGFDTFVSHPEPEKELEHIDHILRWILAHPDDFLQLRKDTDIVCRRRLLQSLLCTPYEDRSGWIVCAVRFDGLLYLTEFDTEKQKKENSNPTDPDFPRWQYWGNKFEQYMLNDPADAKALEQPVNNYNAFHVVLSTKLDDLGLLFNAEMDCLDPLRKDVKPPQCYTELKTSNRLSSPKQMLSFYNTKIRKFWAQNFIAGVPLILVGFKDPNGTVTFTDEISLKDAVEHKLAKQQWSLALCLNFLRSLLSFFCRTSVLDQKQAIYKFQWEPGWDRITAEKLPPGGRYKFIPDWYCENVPKERLNGPV